MDSQIKAVIFDFDGLLFDTEPTWDKTYYIFLKNHNISPNEEVEDEMFGRGLFGAVRLMVDKMGLTGGLQELVDEYRKLFYRELTNNKNVLLPGVLGLLNDLSSKNILIALTSGGHTKNKLVEMLKVQGILKFFSVIVSSDDVTNGKPAPDVYLETLKELNLTTDKCLALEDSPNGVVSAKDAGICVYGVNANDKTRNDLTLAGARKVFVNLGEVEL